MRIPAQIQKFRSRSPESVQTAIRERRKLGVNADKLLGMRVRQWLKEYRVHSVNIPVVAPIPSIRHSTAAVAKPRFLRIIRTANWKSCHSVSIAYLHLAKIRSKPA